MQFIIDYWYLWIAGLILMPIIAVLPQLRNILKAMDEKSKSASEIVRLFLSPVPLVVSIIGAMGTFISFVLFFASIIFAIINFIKA